MSKSGQAIAITGIDKALLVIAKYLETIEKFFYIAKTRNTNMEAKATVESKKL